MTELNERRNTLDDTIDLLEIFRAIWKEKVLVFTIVFMFSVISVCVALFLPNIYKSKALLSPAATEQSSGMSALAGQFGGLAAMAGINLEAGSGIDKITLAMEVMKSRQFLSQFIKKNDLLVPLMASKGWDSSTNSLVLDQDIYNLESDAWTRKANPPRKSEPSDEEAIERFLEIMNVSRDKSTSLITVSIEFYSPYIAKEWVDLLVGDINREMKERDLQEAYKSISYLEEKLTKTNISEMKTVLYQLIESQSKTVMFAEVRDEYIFRTIDSAVVPELKFKPQRALICILGFILGVFFSLFVVFLRNIRS